MRLAQSIGLHEETVPSDSPSAVVSNFQRKRLWYIYFHLFLNPRLGANQRRQRRWMLLWQDTFLSFTYDRPPSTIKLSSSIPYDGGPGNHSFADSVMTLCRILLERARKDDEVETTAAILGYKHRMEQILDANVAAPFLLDKSSCHTLQDHLERLALRIHVCYGVMRVCRLALETTSDTASDLIDEETLKKECADRAAEAVESFLDMHRFSSLVCRSWAFVHNAVSCALTLQSLGTTGMQSSRAQRIVKRLVSVLEREESLSSWEDSDTNVRSFGPFSRALRALRDAVGFGDFNS